MLFLAADSEATARLDDLICSFKAWESIVKDFDHGDLNLDKPQSTQARNSCVSASDAANRAIREAYKWLLAPTEEINTKGFPEMRWEHFALSTGAGSFTKEIERVMTEHELLIERWAPIHLEKLLRTVLPEPGTRIRKGVWVPNVNEQFMLGHHTFNFLREYWAPVLNAKCSLLRPRK